MKRLRKHRPRIRGGLFLLIWLMTTILGVTRPIRAEASPENPIIGTDHPQAEGEVMLFKQVAPVDGLVNTWDITLRVEAKDKRDTADVVLIIDTSGSMRKEGRLEAAKAAGNTFVNTLLPTGTDGTTRIALVSFAENATVQSNFTDNGTTLKNKINSLNAVGGTFTQAALRKARELLGPSTANHKHIVLLSDGEPTYAYSLYNRGYYSTSQYLPYGTQYSRTGYGGQLFSLGQAGYYNVTRTGVPESGYSGNRTGMGYSRLNRYDSGWNFEDLGAATIDEAGFAKTAGATVWSVSLYAGEAGTQILQNVASGSDKAFTATVGDLEERFRQIAGDIKSAARGATVSDPMGKGFVIPIGGMKTATVTDGTLVPVYDEPNNTNSPVHSLTWKLGTLTRPLPEDSTIKYAELKYRIEIDDEILSAEANSDGLYSTNGPASLTYTDIDGKVQKKEFPVPAVMPYLLILEKKVVDSYGNVITNYDSKNKVNTQNPDPRTFDFKITNSAGTYNKTYTMSPGQKRVMTNLRVEDLYTITESATKPSTTALTDYTTTYAITEKIKEGAQQFKVSKNDLELNKTNKFQVTVTNTEKKLGKITVTKAFEANPVPDNGLVAQDGTATEEFEFELRPTNPSGPVQTFKLKVGDTKVFDNLQYGTYQVVEKNKDGFTATYLDDQGTTTDGIVALSIYDKAHSVKVTNTPTNAITYLKILKHWKGGTNSDRPDVTFDILANGVKTGKTIVVKNSMALLDKPDTWANSEKLLRYDNKGNLIRYSLKERPVTGYAQSALTAVTGETDSYEMTNTRVSKLTVKKVVTGTMGNKQKDFSFTLVKNGGQAQNFTLKDGQKFEVQVQAGDRIVITELNALKDGYKVTATLDGTNHTVTPNAQSGAMTLKEIPVNVSDLNVVVTNNRETSPPMGTWRDSSPQLFAVGLGVIGLAAALFKSKKTKPSVTGGGKLG